MSSKNKSKRKQAYSIYKEHEGNIDLVEIARLLDSPQGTVRGWKSKDQWDNQLNGTFREKKRSAPKKKAERSKSGGAPKGNKNAVGNTGGAARPNNKNAVKTGEHETIFAEYLTDDEKDIYSTMSDNPFFIMSEEVKLLKIRQRRMMRRLQEAEKGLNQKEVEVLYQLRKIKTPVESEGRKLTVTTEKMDEVQRTEKMYRSVNDVLAIEEALTRVSNQLIRATKQYDEFVKNNNSSAVPVIFVEDVPLYD